MTPVEQMGGISRDDRDLMDGMISCSFLLNYCKNDLV